VKELTHNLRELQSVTGAGQIVWVLAYCKYRSWLQWSRVIRARILFDGTRWRYVININFRRIFPCTIDHRYVPITWHDVKPRRDGLDGGSSLGKLWDPNHFRPDRRKVTKYTELCGIQTKFSLFLSSLLSWKWGKRKRSVRFKSATYNF
jgi:hypothetical protein